MSSLAGHFGTDWSGMTVSDWIGLTVTVVVFVLMIVLYVYVLKPGSRERLEEHRNIIMNEDSSEKEDRDG